MQFNEVIVKKAALNAYPTLQSLTNAIQTLPKHVGITNLQLCGGIETKHEHFSLFRGLETASDVLNSTEIRGTSCKAVMLFTDAE